MKEINLPIGKMKICEHGDGHEPMDGVLYRRCKKCGKMYPILDKEYQKRKGDIGIAPDYKNLE